MKFVELFSNETEQNELFNMDKAINIAPQIESGGLFGDGNGKEIGSTIYFENGDNVEVKQTPKEIIALLQQNVTA